MLKASRVGNQLALCLGAFPLPPLHISIWGSRDFSSRRKAESLRTPPPDLPKPDLASSTTNALECYPDLTT